ncbi:acyltransferase [Kineosporia rhizophila]|nr:acyltransferase [Kineosporia rhizophila]
MAVLMVLACHASGTLAGELGGTGVTVFFVLSGYLITTLLIRDLSRGSIDFRQFYLRRTLRLVPALLLVVALVPFLYWVVDDPALTGVSTGLLVAVTYCMNYAVFFMDFDTVLYQTWSLAVEEQFYLVWPVALMGLASRQRSPLARERIVLLATVVALAWRLLAAFIISPKWAHDTFDSNAGLLLLGCWLALRLNRTGYDIRASHRGARNTIAWIALAVMIVAPLAVTHLFDLPPYGGSFILAVPIALLSLVLIVYGQHIWVLTNPVLMWFGTISYGLYLWHAPLLGLAPGGEGFVGWERIAATLAAVPVAAASWYLYERRILSWRQPQHGPVGLEIDLRSEGQSLSESRHRT